MSKASITGAYNTASGAFICKGKVSGLVAAESRAQALVAPIYPAGIIMGPDAGHPLLTGGLKLAGPDIGHPVFVYRDRDSGSFPKKL